LGNLNKENMQLTFRFEAIDATGAAGFLNKGKLTLEATGKFKEMSAFKMNFTPIMDIFSSFTIEYRPDIILWGLFSAD